MDAQSNNINTETNNINIESSSNKIQDDPLPQELLFPRKLNFKIWMEYLGRNLRFNEKYMLESYKAERYMNEMLNGLYEQCAKKNLFVPMLTNMDGNCMFESLVYYKIAKNVKELRLSLSLMMYMYKDYKGFLPDTDDTLNDKFNMMNEIEYVVNRKKENGVPGKIINDFYTYAYNVMCQDLSNMHSWSRLPTQLIMIVISYIYKLEIIVISNNGSYEHKINAYETSKKNVKLQTVYLGHLGESHYVPLDVLQNDEEIVQIYYTESKQKLIEWATKMEEIKINNYYEDLKKLEINNVESISQDLNQSTFTDVDLSSIDLNSDYQCVSFS